MATDWRHLLDSVRVPFVERGPNTPRDNISIKCCWCSDDPSHHLAISEVKPAYYCFRNPREHSGTNIPKLIMRLTGMNRADAILLLNNFNTLIERTSHERIKREPGAVARMWDNLIPALENQEILDYLYHVRGFVDPVYACARYDLRYADRGKWAARVMFPIKHDDEVVSWSGRAIRAHMTPKYDMLQSDQQGLVYMPRDSQPHQIIVEGPMDALKIAVATEHLPISAAALTGLQLGPSRLVKLMELLVNTKRIYVALDATMTRDSGGLSHPAPNGAVYNTISALASLNRSWYVSRLAPPNGFDDAAEMNEQDIVRWITSAL